MNIKSLLLGSAAALVAVTGARAADAVVVAEPEPVEYVRVCDTYGAGFFYIPGTETCMRISGVLRYDITWDNRDDFATFNPGSIDTDPISGSIIYNPPGPNNTVSVTFNLNGTVSINGVVSPFLSHNLSARDVEDDVAPSFTVRQTGGDEGWQKTATAQVNVDVRSETEFGTFRRFIRMEGNVNSGQNATDVSVRYAYIELGGLLVGMYESLYDGNMTSYLDDMTGSLRTHEIRYTFNGGNGVTAALSVEEEDYNYDYTPNVVGNVRIAQGWGSAAAWAAYDATAEEWALKGVLSFKATSALTLDVMATYETGRTAYSLDTLAYQGGMAGWEWSLGAAAAFKATDKLTLYVGGQYFGDSHFDGSDNWRLGVQADYKIVDNLQLRSHVRYNDHDFWTGNDYWEGRIRLESSF